MINIIPQPNKVEERNHILVLGNKTNIVGDFDNGITLLKDKLSHFKVNSVVTIFFIKDETLAKEAYVIDCKKDEVNIKASTEIGAFYAIQTILQLLNNTNELKAVYVEDAPTYEFRGFMLDSARHFWTIEQIKQILTIMSNLKLNKFHWHLTDDQGWRPEIKKYPLLTKKGAVRDSTALSLDGYFAHKEPREMKEYGKNLFYSQEELKDIVAFAKKLNIDVIPEIDMPGHLVSAIACYPYLSCEGKQLKVSNRWGVMDDIGCCGKDAIYEFTKDIINELVQIFPYPYFHIGGDEVPKGKWKVCPDCQKKIKELGLKNEEELQGHFNNEIYKYLKTKGKSMIGWNEILDATNLDEDVIVQWWVYRGGGEKERNWVNKGGKTILSIHGSLYMDHSYAMRPLKKTYNFTKETVKIKERHNILGIEAPQWTEYVRTKDKFDFNTFPRMMALSEIGWTEDKNKNYDNFIQRLESLRNYFNAFGINFASKYYYEGNSNKFLFFRKNALLMWRNNPNLELEESKKNKR